VDTLPLGSAGLDTVYKVLWCLFITVYWCTGMVQMDDTHETRPEHWAWECAYSQSGHTCNLNVWVCCTVCCCCHYWYPSCAILRHFNSATICSFFTFWSVWPSNSNSWLKLITKRTISHVCNDTPSVAAWHIVGIDIGNSTNTPTSQWRVLACWVFAAVWWSEIELQFGSSFFTRILKRGWDYWSCNFAILANTMAYVEI